MDERDWVGAHIFYHGDLDQVLVHLVDPLVRKLAGAGLAPAAFYLRYWDGGQHVRLRLLAGSGRHQLVRQRVEQACGELFRARPSTAALDPAGYAPWAAALAAAERVPDYHRQPFPDNSLVFVDYRREHDRYGQGAAIEAVERHFVESSRIALALVRAGLPAGQRDTAALSMLLLAWLGTRPAGQTWPPGNLRAAGGAADEERYQRQQDMLRQLVARMRAMAAQPAGSGAGVLASWCRSVTRLRAGLAAAGTTDVDTARIVDLCAHLVCNRLGVPPAGEAHLRYLAARAVGTAAAVAPARVA